MRSGSFCWIDMAILARSTLKPLMKVFWAVSVQAIKNWPTMKPGGDTTFRHCDKSEWDPCYSVRVCTWLHNNEWCCPLLSRTAVRVYDTWSLKYVTNFYIKWLYTYRAPSWSFFFVRSVDSVIFFHGPYMNIVSHSQTIIRVFWGKEGTLIYEQCLCHRLQISTPA